ncbi:hypothetical protein KHB02_019385 [Bacillus sp. FJAT-50051]|uniref:Uncharacterized protein n=1 Tax=Neobacillus citreus TaxID=2833578 RepID=A0A942T693_9BACI|nr:hypothetical protein [Neobacillus citreus]
MVIQPNMASKAIAEVWKETVEVFQKYNVPITEKALQVLVTENTIKILLTELNKVVGSSTATCIEGG